MDVPLPSPGTLPVLPATPRAHTPRARIAYVIERGKRGDTMLSIAAGIGISKQATHDYWNRWASGRDQRIRAQVVGDPELHKEKCAAVAQARAAAQVEITQKGELLVAGNKIDTTILSRGIAGESMSAIAHDLGIKEHRARQIFTACASTKDKAARQVAVKERNRAGGEAWSAAHQPERVRSRTGIKDGPVGNWEPAVPRPLVEFPATMRFDAHVDPRADRDLGSPRAQMPSPMTWALGGSSLAGIISSGGGDV